MDTYCGTGDKGTAHEEEHNSPSIAEPQNFTPLQVHYLGLLESLIDLKNSYQNDPGQEEWLLKSINNAAYSTFRSCIEHGVEANAKTLLHRERQAN